MSATGWGKSRVIIFIHLSLFRFQCLHISFVLNSSSYGFDLVLLGCSNLFHDAYISEHIKDFQRRSYGWIPISHWVGRSELSMLRSSVGASRRYCGLPPLYWRNSWWPHDLPIGVWWDGRLARSSELDLSFFIDWLLPVVGLVKRVQKDSFNLSKV